MLASIQIQCRLKVIMVASFVIPVGDNNRCLLNPDWYRSYLSILLEDLELLALFSSFPTFGKMEGT